MTKWRRLAWVPAIISHDWHRWRWEGLYCSLLTLLGGRGNVRGVEALLEVSVADALARDVTRRGVTRGRWERECQYYHREETEGSHHAAITARNPLHMVVCPLTARSDLHAGHFCDHGNVLVFVCSLKYASWLLTEELSVRQSTKVSMFMFLLYILSCQWFLHNWLSVFLGLRSTLRPGREGTKSPARSTHAQ